MGILGACMRNAGFMNEGRRVGSVNEESLEPERGNFGA